MTTAGHKTSLAVVLINWNGWQDTLECMSSLLDSSFQDFDIILIDNGSEDGSVEKIHQWAEGKTPIAAGPLPGEPKSYSVRIHRMDTSSKNEQAFSAPVQSPGLFLLESGENLGFAVGCNLGIRFALENKYEFILLLNNDTTVTPRTLRTLADYASKDPSYAVLTPLICYYDRPQRVWMHGGSLTYTGRRRFHYGDQPREKIKKPVTRISFVSGCALWASSKVYRNLGLLTENFFFGEEDYDFSLRLKSARQKISAVRDACVYHKVGRSNQKIFTADRLPYAFIGYLNRLIDRKLHMHSVLGWKLWRMTVLMYIIPKLILLHKYPVKRITRFLSILITLSTEMNQVNRQLFFQIKEQLD